MNAHSKLSRLGAIALVALASTWAAAQSYEVVDLGPNMFPRKINDAGVVVGNMNLPETEPGMPPPSFPFVWRAGVASVLSPAGWLGGSIAAINASGVAVGQARLDDPLRPTAPFILSGATATLIPVDGIGAAGAISDAGVIGGFIQQGAPGSFGGNIPFIMEGGVVTLLPTLTSFGGGGINDINVSGVAVGDRTTADGMGTQSFAWRAGVLTPLPALGQHTTANAINDRGLIVGASNIGETFEQHAVAWENGVIRDLGAVPGAFGNMAADVNADGVIVGSSFGIGGLYGWMHQGGPLVTLDALAGAQTGWQFASANGINAAGEIVGIGIPPGATSFHGYILRTKAQRTIAQMMADLAAGIAALPRRSPAGAALLGLMNAYEASNATNVPALCQALRRLEAEGILQQLATELSNALGCAI
jgi:probable HAF family extracellular repeat protein